MSDQDTSLYVPRPTAYGRIIRERGTLRLVLLAAALALAWFIYDSVHTNMMNQVKWPELQPSKTGLVVLGLKDKDRPGWQHRFEARESNRSWQIRYAEEDMGDHPTEDAEDDLPGAKDRGATNPGSGRGLNSGLVVPNEVLMKECPTVLDGKHFTGSNIEEKFEPFLEKHYYVVHVDLNEEGRSRYWQFSNAHAGERLVFMLNNEVLTCPQMDSMYVGTLSIQPIWVKEDAEKLAAFINGQAKK